MTDGEYCLPTRDHRGTKSSSFPVRTDSFDNLDPILSDAIYAQPHDRRKQRHKSFANAVEDPGLSSEPGHKMMQKVVSEIPFFQPPSGLNQQFWSISVYLNTITEYLNHFQIPTDYAPRKSMGAIHQTDSRCL
jgi:hypothetical protein